jgi:soluble lytic murein transglycosylase
MPATGNFIAMKTRAGPVDREALLEPGLNVRFGSWYLGYLARKFNNNLVWTIAGYNAGPGAVERWAKNGPTEFDEFVEEIPYSETRAYAKRVIKSYTMYLKSGGIDPSRRFVRPIVETNRAMLDSRGGIGGGARR